MNSNSLKLDKKETKKAFERVAARYDDVSVMQQEINRRMASRLDCICFTPSYIVDAGSGTGYGTSLLHQRYTHAAIVEIDMALPMLERSRALSVDVSSMHQRINADIEKLPLASSSVNMVWSNLALQWLNSPHIVLSEFYRVLTQDGLLMFSTLGPETLKELKAVFGKLSPMTHIHPFINLYDWGDTLLEAGFSTPVMDVEKIILTYQDLASMLHDLKNNGAHNISINRRRSLMGKDMWQAMCDHYEFFRQKDCLPATYEIIYGHAWRSGSPGMTINPCCT